MRGGTRPVSTDFAIRVRDPTEGEFHSIERPALHRAHSQAKPKQRSLEPYPPGPLAMIFAKSAEDSSPFSCCFVARSSSST